MYTTEELEQKILSEIRTNGLEGLKNGVYFCEGGCSSPQGTYIFTKEDGYHVLFTEKGVIYDEIITDDYDEVLWYTIEAAFCGYFCHLPGRRARFERELEVFAMFGEKMAKRKKEEIDEILARCPFEPWE